MPNLKNRMMQIVLEIAIIIAMILTSWNITKQFWKRTLGKIHTEERNYFMTPRYKFQPIP